MAVLRIDNFGGERPSSLPRALPADAAQTNQNLHLATHEFRPLAQTLNVAACPVGTRTLHRLARTAAGAFNDNPALGWITSTQDRSYVKGQINDERTERTYFTFDDGSARPRAIDATGADRLLGVPRPATLAATVNVTDELTFAEASTLLYGPGVAALREAVVNATPNPVDPGIRLGAGGTTLAGPYGTFPNGRLHFNNSLGVPAVWAQAWWVMVAQVPQARFEAFGVTVQDAGAVAQGGSVFVPLIALPFAPTFNRAALTSGVLGIVWPAGSGPRSGQAAFTTAQAEAFANLVARELQPGRYAKPQRDQLHAAVMEFAKILLDDPLPPTATRPVEPTRPTVPQFSWNGDTTDASPAWIAYDNAMIAYRAALAAFETAAEARSTAQASAVTKLRELAARAEALTKEIEAAGARAVEKVRSEAFISRVLEDAGGVQGIVGDAVVDRVLDTRFYIATFVTDWGEESAPCAPSAMLELDQNDRVTITRPVTASGETYAARHITSWRLYRSNSGNQTTQFQFVDEISVATPSYQDSKRGEQLGEPCPTLTWAEPPYRADEQFNGYPRPVVGTNPFLRGLTGMPNGIMAGYFDNTVAFCEPYKPYAWPAEYQVVLEFPIVGMCGFDQTLFVGTTANPYFISGADSASMTAQKLDAQQACASARSIAGVPGGVLYASPDGLCLASANGVRVVSGGLFAREDWQLLQPASMFAASHEGMYFLWFTGSGGGCLVFDIGNGKLGRIEQPATAAFTDVMSDTLFVANGTNIQSVFGAAARRTARWRSAVMTMQRQEPLAWLKVYGSQSAAQPAVVRWFGDGVLRHTATLTNTQPVRLPPGRWLEHEVEIESAARLARVVLAGSTAELQQA